MESVEISSSSLDLESNGNNGDEIHIEAVNSSTSYQKYYFPLCSDDVRPKEGIIFQSDEEAFHFYTKYARIAGFDVRKGSTKTRSDGVLTHRFFYCHRQGFNVVKPVDDTKKAKKKSKKTRRVTRCGCEANLVIKRFDAYRFQLYRFEETHNHPLACDVGKQFLRTNRNLSFVQQNLILHCSKVGVGAMKAFQVLKEISGGYQNVGATAIDVKNFKRDLKMFIDGCDAQLVVNKLKHKMETCKSFFFKHDVDKEGTLTHLFWADQTSRRDCILFGDVVSFDATYSSNKYNMVFVPFTGIDNHKISVTLAAGLISKEDIDSYSWLLSCFKHLCGKDPSVIVTDQDPAMKVAIERVFPSSKHRYCMWHITEKIEPKVGVTFCKDTDFLKSISNVIWGEYLYCNQFEQAWNGVIDKFNLADHKWLSDMYELRSSWIPVYFRDVYMGGLLRTTSRSESENSFFGRFLNSHMTLVEFYFGFDSAIDTQRYNRNKAENESKTSTPSLCTKLKIEKHASQVFTIQIFKEYQQEIEAGAYQCGISGISELVEDKYVYSIKDNKYKDIKFEVMNKINTNEMTCNCQKYISNGIICRHLFCVMLFLDYNKIPDLFVLKRWHMDATRMVMPECGDLEDGVINNPNKLGLVVSDIWFNVQSQINKCKEDEDLVRSFLEHVKGFGVDSSSTTSTDLLQSKDSYFESVLGITQLPEVMINAPNIARNKGCGKRIKSAREIAIEESQKTKRKCRYCFELVHHDKRTCPKRLSDKNQQVKK